MVSKTFFQMHTITALSFSVINNNVHNAFLLFVSTYRIEKFCFLQENSKNII